MSINEFRQKIKDGRHNKCQNGPHGTIFHLGNIKIRFLDIFGITKIVVNKYLIRVHGDPIFQLDYIEASEIFMRRSNIMDGRSELINNPLKYRDGAANEIIGL